MNASRLGFVCTVGATILKAVSAVSVIPATRYLLTELTALVYVCVHWFSSGGKGQSSRSQRQNIHLSVHTVLSLYLENRRLQKVRIYIFFLSFFFYLLTNLLTN